MPEDERASPLEPLVKESKVYAPGVGLVNDGSLVIVSLPSGPLLDAPASHWK